MKQEVILQMSFEEIVEGLSKRQFSVLNVFGAHKLKRSIWFAG